MPNETPEIDPDRHFFLERLTELLDLVDADKQAAEDVEGYEDVSAASIAHVQAPEAVQPGVRAFHHPAVTSEALAVVHATPGNTGPDATDTALLAVLSGLVPEAPRYLTGSRSFMPMS